MFFSFALNAELPWLTILLSHRKSSTHKLTKSFPFQTQHFKQLSFSHNPSLDRKHLFTWATLESSCSVCHSVTRIQNSILLDDISEPQLLALELSLIQAVACACTNFQFARLLPKRLLKYSYETVSPMVTLHVTRERCIQTGYQKVHLPLKHQSP